MLRARIFRLLELIGALARRIGLGFLVARVRAAVQGRLGTFARDVGGVVLEGRVGLHDHYVAELASSQRERTLARLVADAVPPGGTVLDVGAHLGYVSIVAARAAGARGRVLAVEPNPDTLPLLERNLAANGVSGVVQVVPYALSDHQGSGSLHLSPSGDGSSPHANVATTGPTVSVRSTTAAALLGERAVDVVKIDVEGAELAVLDGLAPVLERSPSAVLFVECNPDTLAAAGTSALALLDRLAQLGLRAQAIDEAGGRLVPVVVPAPGEPYVNLRCARS